MIKSVCKQESTIKMKHQIITEYLPMLVRHLIYMIKCHFLFLLQEK